MRSATGETRKFESAASGASSAVDRTGSSFQRLGNSASRALSGVVGSVTSTVTSIVGMGTAIAGAAAAFGVYKIGKAALSLAGDAEQADIAFTTMLGSAEKSQKFIADLTQFANKTPFELPQVRDASKKMLAFGFDAQSVIPMLTGVGNAASGLGMGKDGIDRITLALGQMKAKSKVSGDEMLQLTEAGIPAWQILADKMKITTAQVMKMGEKGVIPADKAITALIDGMNKRFPDMMAKQSHSLSGLWSTMKDTFNNGILKRFGDGIGAALKPRFEQVTKWIDANGDTIDRWGSNIAKAANKAADGIFSAFDKAYRYVKDRYIDNQEFRDLSIEGKVKFVISDVLKLFNDWMAGEGGQQVTSITNTLVASIANGLDSNSGAIVMAAKNLGSRLGKGIADGLEESLANNPLLSMLAGGALGARFGIIGAAAGSVTGAVASFVSQANVTAANKDKPHTVSPEDQSTIDSINKAYYGDVYSDAPYGPPSPSPTKRANGLERVPYNGFPIIAHKDETLLNKADADARRNGGGAPNVTVTGNTFIVRQDSDIQSIARELARELMGLQGATA